MSAWRSRPRSESSWSLSLATVVGEMEFASLRISGALDNACLADFYEVHNAGRRIYYVMPVYEKDLWAIIVGYSMVKEEGLPISVVSMHARAWAVWVAMATCSMIPLYLGTLAGNRCQASSTCTRMASYTGMRRYTMHAYIYGAVGSVMHLTPRPPYVGTLSPIT